MLVHLYFNQGTLQRRLGHHAEAAAAFSRAFEASDGFSDEHPHRVRSLIGLLRARLALGRTEQARTGLEQLAQLTGKLEEGHVAHLWHRVLERRLHAEPLGVSLAQAVRESDDEELIAYVETASSPAHE